MERREVEALLGTKIGLKIDCGAKAARPKQISPTKPPDSTRCPLFTARQPCLPDVLLFLLCYCCWLLATWVDRVIAMYHARGAGCRLPQGHRRLTRALPSAVDTRKQPTSQSSHKHSICTSPQCPSLYVASTPACSVWHVGGFAFAESRPSIHSQLRAVPSHAVTYHGSKQMTSRVFAHPRSLPWSKCIVCSSSNRTRSTDHNSKDSLVQASPCASSHCRGRGDFCTRQMTDQAFFGIHFQKVLFPRSSIRHRTSLEKLSRMRRICTMTARFQATAIHVNKVSSA